MIRWLYVVAAMIVLIVVVGGVTRLTESGLSITQWKPITGVIPPLTQSQWQAEFANYRRIPQYEAIHHGMTLAGFKGIFFWEYLHRLLGRLIGTVFAVPLVWFAIRRQIPRGYGWRLVALLALGGLQGALGWVMVRSGLSDRTEVAPLWLAAHLLTALFTLAGLVWTALDLRALAANPYAKPARLTALGALAGAVLAVQLLYGALMAGLRAGLVTNQWPLMNGRFFPHEVLGTRPFGTLLLDDPSLVHFIHRWWAWVTVAALIVLARAAKRARHRAASVAIHSAFGVQILLGIATVMTGVDITLAALHQLVGALLVIATTWGVHAIGRRRG
ncbi:COX15/CtaA family protein [Sphingomonas sp. NFR15]|uniref:COX15/CtaA family protein n=2 Tax=Sphingomonas TaxID=13687 RepID=UPI0021095772|nr:COX15/CtaA family protein [Sphingomonas sp. NFR15]